MNLQQFLGNLSLRNEVLVSLALEHPVFVILINKSRRAVGRWIQAGWIGWIGLAQLALNVVNG
jgi:hypothetical protein